MHKPHTHTNNQESLPSDVIYETLFTLIDDNIHKFLSYKKEDEDVQKKYGKMSKKTFESETDISNSLDSFLNFRLPNSFFKFHFKYEAKVVEKNERTDIGVISRRYNEHLVICFIEAKRLPTGKKGSSREKEYVLNGIGRFKTGKHGGGNFPLRYSIMLGYIQKQTHAYWHSEVNNWIESQINTPSNSEINWTNQDKLIHDTTFTKKNITKYSSTHSRKSLKNIKMLHYWIDVN
jgi:hypothetical protein